MVKWRAGWLGSHRELCTVLSKWIWSQNHMSIFSLQCKMHSFIHSFIQKVYKKHHLPAKARGLSVNPEQLRRLQDQCWERAWSSSGGWERVRPIACPGEKEDLEFLTFFSCDSYETQLYPPHTFNDHTFREENTFKYFLCLIYPWISFVFSALEGWWCWNLKRKILTENCSLWSSD